MESLAVPNLVLGVLKGILLLKMMVPLFYTIGQHCYLYHSRNLGHGKIYRYAMRNLYSVSN